MSVVGEKKQLTDQQETVFSIGDLERESGMPRSTIYFYIRAGLLPPGQKSVASRAVYSQSHLELLRGIIRLREEGLSLDDIRVRLGSRIQAVEHSEADLVALQSERIREAILQTAARHFAREGYKRTRISDIIDEVGITPPVLYSHFATKEQLFAECIAVFETWSHEFVEPEASAYPDPTEREMRRVNAFFSVQALSPDYLALARLEGLREGGEVSERAQRFYDTIIEGPMRDLAALRAQYGTWPPISDELVMRALVGALEAIATQATFDSRYSRLDILRAHLFLYLCVQAAFTGKLDLNAEMARYEDLLRELEREGPPALPDASV